MRCQSLAAETLDRLQEIRYLFRDSLSLEPNNQQLPHDLLRKLLNYRENLSLIHIKKHGPLKSEPITLILEMTRILKLFGQFEFSSERLI